MPAANLARASAPGLGSCYFPGSGSQLASNQHPCDLHSPVSMCCPTGWTCFSNKLCIATDAKASKADLGTTRRGTCTNPEWDDDTCGNFCKDEKDGSMTACGNDSWCCSADIKGGKCDCDSGDGTFKIKSGKAVALVGFVNGQFTVTTGSAIPTNTGSAVSASKTSSKMSSDAASSTASAAASSSATAASSSTSGPDAQESNSSSPTLGKILGPIFGVIGFIVIVALVWFFWRRRNRRDDISPSPSPEPRQDLMAFGSTTEKPLDSQVVSSISGNTNDGRAAPPMPSADYSSPTGHRPPNGFGPPNGYAPLGTGPPNGYASPPGTGPPNGYGPSAVPAAAGYGYPSQPSQPMANNSNEARAVPPMADNGYNSRPVPPAFAAGVDRRPVPPMSGNAPPGNAPDIRSPPRASNDYDAAAIPPISPHVRDSLKARTAIDMRETLHANTPPAIAMTSNPIVSSVNDERTSTSTTTTTVTSPTSNRTRGYSATTSSITSQPPKRASGYTAIFSSSTSNRGPVQNQARPSFNNARSPPTSPSAMPAGESEGLHIGPVSPKGKMPNEQETMNNSPPPPPPPHLQPPAGDWAPRRSY